MARQAERAALKARQTGDRTTLFWSERGAVCCALHAPYPGTDTWIWERWRLITGAEQQEWARAVGSAPRCEICRKED